jgi:hypothetical protein
MRFRLKTALSITAQQIILMGKAPTGHTKEAKEG